MALSFVELPKCDFAVNLKVGGGKHTYDVSKISKVSDFVVSMLKKLLWKNAVMPNRLTFSLPSPGKKFTLKTTQVTSRTSELATGQSTIPTLNELEEMKTQLQQQIEDLQIQLQALLDIQHEHFSKPAAIPPPASSSDGVAHSP